MGVTTIEWATHVWNPITGCTPISPGCDNCYAARMANRLQGRYGYPKTDPFCPTIHVDYLRDPLRWKKPRRVFVGSMGDLFHDEFKLDFIREVFRIMARASQHTFMVLTKRAHRMKRVLWRLLDEAGQKRLPRNIWLGVSAENQEWANIRIPPLKDIPALVHFVSLEPLLGPIRFKPPALPDWAIVGGESGAGARPTHQDWVRSIRDQCAVMLTPFFFKGWGDWLPTDQEPHPFSFQEKKIVHALAGEKGTPPWFGSWKKVGKKYSGAILDGVEWNELPETNEDAWRRLYAAERGGEGK